MVISNPVIQKPRKPNWTVLAVGKGETERAFLQFLKGQLNKRDDGISIRIIYAGGGSPECIIHHAIKMNPKNYDCAFALLDMDVPCGGSYLEKARINRLELIWCVPCIEGLFLKILETDFDPRIKSAFECKKLFADNYLNDDEKLDPKKYEIIFSYDLIERRVQVEELATLTRLMTVKGK
jgi:hypothetical protein